MSEVPSRQVMARQMQLHSGRPDVLPGRSDIPDAVEDRLYNTLDVRPKDSVARMTWDGISYVVSVSLLIFKNNDNVKVAKACRVVLKF